MPTEKRVHYAIDRAYRKARRVKLDLEMNKWILFSDHHRGCGDSADDFMRCKSTYGHALNYYLESDFSLGLLGDVEELWENKIQAPLKEYADAVEQESLFLERTDMFRIWGNHDDFWREKLVFWHYFKKKYKRIRCHECVVLDCFRDDLFIGEIVLIHGHQGSWLSEKFATFSRFFVRYGWRNFQRISGIKLTSASKDLKLKSKTDHAMYRWSEKNEKVLICGHTHQPVFMSGTHLDLLMDKLHHSIDDEERRALEQEIVRLQKGRTQIHTTGGRKPLYFNTGCCSYSDGDITGIEINTAGITLIKWSEGNKERTVLNSVPLEHLFDKPHVHE